VARQWSTPTPGLNTETDKPTQEMEFYDFGWQGQVERLYDKVIVTKTIKGPYGTPIVCMQTVWGQWNLMCAWGASEVKLNQEEQKKIDDLYASLHNRSLWESNENDNEKKKNSSEALTEANDPFSIKARLGPGPDPKPKFSNLHSRRWATEDQPD